MRPMLLAVSALALLPFFPTAAAGEGGCAEWAAGPEGLLLTDAERTACEGLTGPDEAAAFIDLFWARRDPDLATRANQVRDEMAARIAAADERFGEDDLRGALTDRGRVLILLGPPAERSRGPAGEYLARVYGTDETAWRGGVRSRRGATTVDPARGEAEMWVFQRDQIPEQAGLGARAETLVAAFVDPRGDGVFALDRSHPEFRVLQRVLAAMPELLAPNLELAAMPTYPLVDGGAAATAVQLAWLDGAGWPEGSVVHVGTGIGTVNQRPRWVFVRLPGSVPVADRAVLRVTEPDGAEVGTLAVPVAGLASSRGTTYELRLPDSGAGRRVELALANGEGPVAAGPVEVPEAPAEGVYVTEFMAGAEVAEDRDFVAGEPFIFGGYHLVLRPEGRYLKSENMAYFCLAAIPSAAEGAAQAARVRLRLRRGGQVVYQPPPRDVELSAVAPGVFMFGSQFPLSALPEAGEYLLTVKLSLADGSAERESELPIVIEEDSQ